MSDPRSAATNRDRLLADGDLLPCTCHGEDLVPYCPRHTPLPGEDQRSAAYGGWWSNLPVKAPWQSSAGICGQHGLFVGTACPKCVTQVKPV